MKENDTWKTNGLVIGSPAYRISNPDTTDKQAENKHIENPKDDWVLINQITLSSEQAEELLKFLIAKEHILILMAAEEDRVVHEAPAMVGELLLESGRDKREVKESGMKGETSQKKIIPISLPR